jgi:periplasmic protein TonB
MTTNNAFKFSVALSAAVATHLGILAYAVSPAEPTLVAGNGFSIQIGSQASATENPSADKVKSDEAEPSAPNKSQPPPNAPEPVHQSAPPKADKAGERKFVEATSQHTSDSVFDERFDPGVSETHNPVLASASLMAPSTEANAVQTPVESNAPPASASEALTPDENAEGAPADPSSTHTRTSPAPSEAGNSEYSNYAGKVMQHLSRLRRPRASAPGSAHVRFVIAQNGSIRDIEVSDSSGSSRFDREAVSFVKKASPFPPPPAGLNRSFTVEIKGR